MADVRIKYKVDKGELVLAREELEKIEKEIGVTENKSKGLSKEFKVIGGAIAAAFTIDKLVDFGKQVISITAEFQKLKAVLTNTLGSRSAADQAFKNIQDFASKTPFQVKQLTDSFVKLANQGFVPTTKELRKLGDLAASTGKEFDQLTEAIIDAQVGEFERLKEFGIRAQKEGDNVTFTFKGVQTQVGFTSESIRDYILSLGDAAGVSGSMAAISETLGGKLSNMQDNIDSLLYAIGQQFNPIIGGAIDAINGLIGAVTDYINVPYTEALKMQQLQLNTLVGAITNVNTSEEARTHLIQELNAQYPDFLKNLSEEERTNENISKRLEDVNGQFLRKIALSAAEERLKEQQEELLDNIEREASLRKTLNMIDTEGARGREAEGKARQTNERRLNEVLEERERIQKDLTEQLQTYTDALDIFNQKNNDYFETTEKVVEQAQERVIPSIEVQKKGYQDLSETIQSSINKNIEKTESDKAQADTSIEVSKNETSEKLKALNTITEGYGKQTAVGKASAITRTTIATYESATQAFKALAGIPVVGPALGAAAAAAATISGLRNIGIIRSTQVPRFAKGVLDLKGPGSETSDSIHAMLSRGESVMTARETKDFLPTLKAIRENKIDPKLLNSIVNNGPQVIHSVNEVPRDIINIDENGFSKYLVTRQQKSQVLTSKYRT